MDFKMVHLYKDGFPSAHAVDHSAAPLQDEGAKIRGRLDNMHELKIHCVRYQLHVSSIVLLIVDVLKLVLHWNTLLL